MNKYNIGKVISDKSSIGAMKDAYLLILLSTDTVKDSIIFGDYHILFLFCHLIS